MEDCLEGSALLRLLRREDLISSRYLPSHLSLTKQLVWLVSTAGQSKSESNLFSNQILCMFKLWKRLLKSRPETFGELVLKKESKHKTKIQGHSLPLLCHERLWCYSNANQATLNWLLLLLDANKSLKTHNFVRAKWVSKVAGLGFVNSRIIIQA